MTPIAFKTDFYDNCLIEDYLRCPKGNLIPDCEDLASLLNPDSISDLLNDQFIEQTHSFIQTTNQNLELENLQLDAITLNMLQHPNTAITSEPKSANVEEYHNLFRGLSTFTDVELENLTNIADKKPAVAQLANVQQQLHQEHTQQVYMPSNQETTIDLTDLLLQEQLLHGTHITPVQGSTTITPLTNVDMRTSDHEANISELQIPIIIANDNIVEPTATAPAASVQSGSRIKSTVLKRLSSKSGKGAASSLKTRRLTSTRPSNFGKMKLSKKQQAQLAAAESELARFGNKFVEKYTDEYEQRRMNNNEAVKKCREKLTKTQQMREERMRQLADENKKLLGTVDTLSKELNVLKGIIIKMHNKLPEHLEKLIAELNQP